jgi:hypothetical protein
MLFFFLQSALFNNHSNTPKLPIQNKFPLIIIIWIHCQRTIPDDFCGQRNFLIIVLTLDNIKIHTIQEKSHWIQSGIFNFWSQNKEIEYMSHGMEFVAWLKQLTLCASKGHTHCLICPISATNSDISNKRHCGVSRTNMAAIIMDNFLGKHYSLEPLTQKPTK